ncbi:MAG: FliA/WhiG family RNA polymerase sigma factor [Acidimicrobiales bacterium]
MNSAQPPTTSDPQVIGSSAGLLSEEDLIREHLDLVRKMVAQTTARVPSHVSRDDLLSAGMAGLAMAARAFDAARGVPFDRYAATRIRGAVIDELRSFDWASRPVRTKARALAATTESLTGRLGRAPTDAELAEAAGLSIAALGRLTDDVHRAVVLNYEAILETGDSEVLLPYADGDPEEELLTRERADCLTKAIDALPARLRTVVRGYFFEERTVTDIAEELGVTQSRVSQLRSEAIELLRDGVNSQLDPANVSPLRRSTGRVSRRQAAYRATMAHQADAVGERRAIAAAG